MVEKHYTDDWAKSKARDLLRGVIERTLLTFRKPHDLKVLCFPGIDAVEIFEVYDRLNIPRENIVGVEREKEIAQAIKAKKLGIHVVPKSLEDYLLDGDTYSYDIVSTDFTSPISIENLDALKKLCAGQQRKHFVLHTANLIKRDAHSLPYYMFGYVRSESANWGNFLQSGDINNLEVIKNRTKLFYDMSGSKQNMVEEKRIAYQPIIKSSFAGGSARALIQLYAFARGISYSESIADMSKTVRRENVMSEEEVIHLFNPLFSAVVENYSFKLILQQCRKNGLMQQITPMIIFALSAVSKESKWFREKEFIPYSYVSESGSPMVGNIYFLSFPEREIIAARDFARTVGYPQKFEVRDQHQALKLLEVYSKHFVSFSSTQQLNSFISRAQNPLFLGSSAKPVLTKSIAIQAFKAGKTVDEVKSLYRGCNSKPLAQWKAHVTMGTYDTRPSGDEEMVVAEEDRNLETITKEEALDLLTSGIPPQEIFDAYPTSFSVGQLRAFKAHQTMGTYEDT